MQVVASCPRERLSAHAERSAGGWFSISQVLSSGSNLLLIIVAGFRRDEYFEAIVLLNAAYICALGLHRSTQLEPLYANILGRKSHTADNDGWAIEYGLLITAVALPIALVTFDGPLQVVASIFAAAAPILLWQEGLRTDCYSKNQLQGAAFADGVWFGTAGLAAPIVLLTKAPLYAYLVLWITGAALSILLTRLRHPAYIPLGGLIVTPAMEVSRRIRVALAFDFILASAAGVLLPLFMVPIAGAGIAAELRYADILLSPALFAYALLLPLAVRRLAAVGSARRLQQAVRFAVGQLGVNGAYSAVLAAAIAIAPSLTGEGLARRIVYATLLASPVKALGVGGQFLIRSVNSAPRVFAGRALATGSAVALPLIAVMAYGAQALPEAIVINACVQSIVWWLLAAIPGHRPTWG